MILLFQIARRRSSQRVHYVSSSVCQQCKCWFSLSEIFTFEFRALNTIGRPYLQCFHGEIPGFKMLLHFCFLKIRVNLNIKILFNFYRCPTWATLLAASCQLTSLPASAVCVSVDLRLCPLIEVSGVLRSFFNLSFDDWWPVIRRLLIKRFLC